MQPDRKKQQEEHNKAVIDGMVKACAKFQRVFSGTEGEEVLAMIEANVPKTVFDKDPFIHAHNQGKRELMDFILNGLDDKKLKQNIERMKQMCKEQKNV
jgi:hypothetical protein